MGVRARVLVPTFVAAGAVVIALAGPLNPPTGSVASTYKTLSEVEPRIAINATNTPGDPDSLFKITLPGSYYLTGNITGVVGKHGIEIAASGVTLDLMGFDLVGVPGMGAFDGVTVTVSSLRNIAVVNGSVRSWGGDGVDLVGQVGPSNCRLEGVVAIGNMDSGITAGNGTTVTNCSVYNNSNYGIKAFNGCSITNCTAGFNSGKGISTFGNCSVTNCSAYFTTGDGIDSGGLSTVTNCSANTNTGNGISAPGGGTIADCTASANSLNGISAGTGSTVVNCSASANGLNGISAGTGCTILDCSASNNTINGINTSDNCTVVNCSASANTGHGISTFNGCTITNCTANNNLARGISTNNGCQVSGCLTRTNLSDGIVVNFACTVSGNTCNGDGTAVGDQGGIRVLGQANRVESNNVTFADRGLLVDAGGNVIVRNTVSSCTVNWVIAANNKCLVVLGVNGAAINGNSGGTSPGSTDPNANFSY